MGTIAVFAENKTEKFKVYGSCGMCEQRIEKTVKSMNGVTKADWYKETKMLKVTFDESKVKLEDIQKKLAEVGHDTNRFKASDKVYKALPECCKYRE
jgi:copper chaperone CopZ